MELMNKNKQFVLAALTKKNFSSDNPIKAHVKFCGGLTLAFLGDPRGACSPTDGRAWGEKKVSTVFIPCC